MISTMADHSIIVPAFLDRPVPGIAKTARSGDPVIPPVFAEGKQIERVAPVHRALDDEVERTVKAGERPVAIMGDCCMTIPILAGIRRAGIEPQLIWLDAHGDFNTWETTPSGFLGGMPLAMIVGLGEPAIARAVGLRTLPVERVWLVGARDLDPGERVNLRTAGVRRIGVEELARVEPPPGP